MGIGAGIFLIAVGAILSFAVRGHVGGVNLVTVGYILMGAGVLGLILGFVMMRQRSHTSHVSVQERRTINDGVPQQVVQQPVQPVVQQPVQPVQQVQQPPQDPPQQ